MNSHDHESARPPSNQALTSDTSMWVALGAAIGASACCLVPLALVSLGIGGAWIGALTVLEPYRWGFVAIAIGSLGYAGYNEWRLSRKPDCDCETALSSAARRSLLGLGAVVVAALIASPQLIASSAGGPTSQAAAVTTGDSARSDAHPVSYRQVVLEVEGMTCKTCPIAVRKALEGVEGVHSVEATYEPPEAVVRFDPARVSLEALTKATNEAGFPSQLAGSS